MPLVRAPKKSFLPEKYWFEKIRDTGSKTLSKLKKTNDNKGFYLYDDPLNYVVLSWQSDKYKFDNVYNELSLQHYLSNIDCMPKIKWCFETTNKTNQLYKFDTVLHLFSYKTPILYENL